MLELSPVPKVHYAHKEKTADLYLPYTRHVTKDIVALRSRALMSSIALEGISFETTNPADLDIFKNQLNLLWRNVAHEQLAVYTYMVRRRCQEYPEGVFWSPFAQKLDARYRQKMVGQTLYKNQWFLTLIWMPAPQTKLSFWRRFIPSLTQEGNCDKKSLGALEDVRRTVIAALERYTPKVLSLYEKDGLWFSQIMEFLRLIGTVDALPMPLVDGLLGRAVYMDRLVFGRDTFEIRAPGFSKLGGILGVKEYPASTRSGMLNALLAAPFECVLGQSFAMMNKTDARTAFSLKQGQMLNVGDRAHSQINQLDEALDDLESNRFTVGHHHLNLMVVAESRARLLDNMSHARRILSESGLVTAREDLALEASYWGLFPGLFNQRPRSGTITSKNFAALSGFHTYPTGSSKSHWGSSVALLKTDSGCPYHFNFHYGDVGNTFICGPSGSGKTVFQNFTLAQLQKHDTTMIFFDKDRGADLFVCAAGGKYLPLRTGVPTGCAPLQALDFDHPTDFAFLTLWVKKLIVPKDGHLNVQESEQIHNALLQMGQMPSKLRCLKTLRDFFPVQEREGIGARLERWYGEGALAWVFDHPCDALTLDQKFMGFDMTEFLDNAEIRTPLMMYLFHRIEKLIDGRRLVIDIDEFWKALGDEAFKALAQNKLKTIRKQNGLMIFGTQSPKDALLSDIGHTIIEQCTTHVFMPNPRGSYEDYVEGFKLTQREFDLIQKELTPESRQFLIKQGHTSVVAELDLHGFDEELTVLSGRTKTIEAMDALIAEHGETPENWLPLLLKAEGRKC